MRSIQTILNQYSEISDYVIQDRHTVSSEWFFIKENLDQNRRKDVQYTKVKIFVDDLDKKFRGHAEITLYPSHKQSEIEDMIKEAIASAKLIKNGYYILPKEEPIEYNQSIKEDVMLNSSEIIDFIFRTEKENQGEINSFEVFVNHHTIGLLNMNGLDIHFTTQDCMIEVIVNAKTPTEEIELFKEFKFEKLNQETLGKQLRSMFQLAKDRAKAKATPKLKKSDLILSLDNVAELFKVYESSTNVASLYNHSSNLTLDGAVQTDKALNPLNISMLNYLEGSMYNAPVDSDGVILKSVDIIQNGVFKETWGDARHSYYLSKPCTGQLQNMKVQSGNTSVKDLEAGVALEVIDFSSFIVDSQSGDFSGEIRLAYHHSNGQRVAVSGGSVSGNLFELHDSMILSKETQSNNNFTGPLKIRLKDVSIAGIE